MSTFERAAVLAADYSNDAADAPGMAAFSALRTLSDDRFIPTADIRPAEQCLAGVRLLIPSGQSDSMRTCVNVRKQD